MFRMDHARRAESFASVRAGVPANVWFIGATSLLTDISSEMIVSALPAYLVLQLGLTPLAFGTIDGLYQGAGGVARVASGFLADRAGRYKPLAVAGYALSAATKAVLLVVSGASAIAATLVVDRVGKGIRTAPRDALIAGSVPAASRGAAFGVHRSLDSIGATLGPFVAFGVLTLAARAFDAVFVVSLMLALTGLAALALLVREPIRADAAPRASAAGAVALLRSPRLLRLALAAGPLSLATVSDGFLYLVLQQRTGFPAVNVPLMFAATAVCYFLTAGPLGVVGDRAGRRAVFLGGYGALLAAYAIVLAPVGGIVAVVALVVLLGVYYGATDGILAAIASTALPAHLRGTGLAAVATVVSVARAASSVLFGYLWTVWDASTVVGLFILMLVVSMAIAAAALAGGPDEAVS